MEERTFDVVLYGATGFAGQLVATYLKEHHPDLRWAIAGRNRGKLQALAKQIDVEFRVADSRDAPALNALAAECKVICTTVGPYAKYGETVVAAAIAQGTHTCDLTGEPQFIRRMMDAHHDQASAAGVAIVNSCGFDSIPSDLGTLVLQEAAIERFDGPCDEIEFVLKGASGGISGGTIASMVQVLNEASDPAVRRVLGDPYSLATERGPDSGEQRGSRYSEAAGVWTGPFMMAGINERVVRRSNSLLDYRYGRDFRYGESMQMGRGLQGRLKAMGTAAGMGAFTGAMLIPPLRQLILKRLPSPGEGPSEEAIRTGWFKARLFGKRRGEVVLTVDVTGQRDPGYGATACMLGEAAVQLANDGPKMAGVTTPASALGLPLVERLHQQLVQFEVLD